MLTSFSKFSHNKYRKNITSRNDNYQFLTKKHLLFDLIYNPAETAFLIEGKKRGAQIKNGFEMLELQAEESWRIWNK